MVTHIKRNTFNLCELYNSSIPQLRKKKNSINSVKEASEIMVYPNPTKENFNISLEIEADANANILIFDLSGKKVLESQLKSGTINIAVKYRNS